MDLRALNFVLFVCFVVSLVFVSLAARADAQERFDAGAQISAAHSSEFDAGDVGFGGRFAWRPVDLIGVEAEMNVYPRRFPSSRSVAFSSGRVEGLFGVTAGPRFARVRPFAKLRPGFLTFRRQAIACILIFPPPLSCQLAAGRTVFALDAGGGIELFPTGRTVIRIDAGDRLLKYPGPSFRDGRATQESFFSHDFRFSAGAGVRF
ncbi:MAG TPA: hypothetical protein VEP46_03150 [Vicinamibacterales bacterium]|nr:hypothetical protein [Vicinamibacterales bacterium]